MADYERRFLNTFDMLDSHWGDLVPSKLPSNDDKDTAIEKLKGYDFFLKGACKTRFSGLQNILTAVDEQRGLAGLQAWVNSIDGDAPGMESYKLEATSRMLEVLRNESPERAANWVAANAGQGFIKGSDIVSTAKVFAETPQGQLNWITALPGEADRSAIYLPFRAFLRDDFDAAAAWLVKQPADPIYDKVIAHFAQEAAAYDPQAARLWANEITEERLKEFMLKDIDKAQQTEVPRP